MPAEPTQNLSKEPLCPPHRQPCQVFPTVRNMDRLFLCSAKQLHLPDPLLYAFKTQPDHTYAAGNIAQALKQILYLCR